ncbi:MAG: HD domain-containing phosphohydrolase [Thermodesulfobacteriota bacterium]
MSDSGFAAPVKVLFVDDEKNILKALDRLFMDEPYEVLTAGSGEEGLEVLRTAADVGVIVSDQRMPSMQGTEFLAQAMRMSPDTLRILLTGYADLNAVVDAINMGGAYRYVAKPWQDDELIQIVRDAARQFKLIQENRRLERVVRRQNEELKEWNAELEWRVQEQTIEIANRNKALEEMNGRLKKSFDDTLASFAGLIELRDPSERHHSRNVSALAEALAAAAGLPAEEIETVRVAALIHDIGKVVGAEAIPPGGVAAMTPAQRSAYKEHPVRGQTVVDSIEALRSAGVLIRHHHERWDGAGFPDGLRGQAIPLGARILALADFADREMSKCRGANAPELVLKAVRGETDAGRIDPGLVPHSEKVVPEILSRARVETDAYEVAVGVPALRAGMVLSRDALSGTGVLLLRAGTVLEGAALSALTRHLELDPTGTGVFVFRKKGAR